MPASDPGPRASEFLPITQRAHCAKPVTADCFLLTQGRGGAKVATEKPRLSVGILSKRQRRLKYI